MRVLICVAWPNASGPRHLGHAAGCYLPADIVARYHRLAGDEVLMVSGSDEHGTPITVAADRLGIEPAVLAEREHKSIAATFHRLGLSFDRYTRTTTTNHARVVHRMFGALRERGFVEESTQDAAVCPDEERSIPDRYVTGRCPHCGRDDARGDQCDACGATLDADELADPRCGRCGARAVFRPLRQLFLRLDLLQPVIEAFVAERGARWRPFVAAETAGWLRAGLRPRAITRDLGWGVGVPLPGWDDRRFYVWFEDVIGYLSATIEHTGEAYTNWWAPGAALHRYFLGKDNIWFHTIWWPALLLGSGEALHLPDDVVANHYLTLGADKMSSSREHGFAVDEAIDRVGVDAIRHALCALGPQGADVEFTWPQCEDLTRTGLLGAIANPAHRVATLLWKRCGGRVDAGVWASASERAEASLTLQRIGEAFRSADLRRALTLVHDVGRAVNRRLGESEPWRLREDAARTELTRLTPALDVLGVAAWPIVPGTASRIRAALGRAPDPVSWEIDDAPPRIATAPVPPLER